MVLPNTLGALQEKGQYPRPGEHAGWMGPRYNPLTTQVPKRNLEDNPYWRNCVDEELTFQIAGMARPDGVSLDRLDRRRSLLQQFDSSRQSLEQFNGEGYDPFREKAFSLMTSERTRQALDIRRESAELRDRYGRHLFGQSTLMARRLVEAGVRYVTVHYDCVDGYSWDSHRNSDDVKKNLLPTFDQACSALLTDLDDRGLLQETLVIATGEMGRTPKANAQWGRDHWSTLFSTVIAGGGIRQSGRPGSHGLSFDGNRFGTASRQFRRPAHSYRRRWLRSDRTLELTPSSVCSTSSKHQRVGLQSHNAASRTRLHVECEPTERLIYAASPLHRRKQSRWQPPIKC